MDSEADPLIPSAPPPYRRAHPPDLDLNSTPSPSPSPPPTARRSTATTPGKLPWIPLAAASGACAAINGVFAKLTTTALTTAWATSISHVFGLKEESKVIEVLIRAMFFVLNLAFNALMWAVFTAALTRASSTTRVSVVNTSANFMLTAVAGWIIFGERLNGLWWVGAVGLGVGNVVIGRRDEEGEEDGKGRGRLDGEGNAEEVELEGEIEGEGEERVTG